MPSSSLHAGMQGKPLLGKDLNHDDVAATPSLSLPSVGPLGRCPFNFMQSLVVTATCARARLGVETKMGEPLHKL